ncbi:hypothetical protein [Arthrobacter sp. N199823]|uniref:hypothetical protein n=1 Tax=Arthrobacter sp. N199823 TaxID=2058895 RepID=UPI000CE4AE32|nr:hypothetical protein [Arthrobacter sp. N199823]
MGKNPEVLTRQHEAVNRRGKVMPPVNGMAFVIAGLAATAFLTRLVPLLESGTLGGFRGYDDAVHYAAGVHLLAGSIPYQDFVLVHPPGIAVLMTPFAALGWLVSDTVGIGSARVFFALLGALNTVMIGLLLKKWGHAAVVAGAGLYAVSTAATIAERSVMLSPLLTTCTLLALVALRSDSRLHPRRAVTVAGAVLGLALCFKLWAVIPILVLCLMVAARFGTRLLLRFVVAGAAACTVVMGPFFLASPRAMFKDVILAQLARTDGAMKDLSYRLGDFVGISLPQNALTAVAAVGALAILVSALMGLAQGFKPGFWADEFWWAAVAGATAAVLLMSMSFFDHYPNFTIAYIALCLGVVVGLATRAVSRRRKLLPQAVASAMVVGLLVPIGIHGFELNPKPLPGVNETKLAREVSEYDCVFTAYAYLGVISNSMSSSMHHGCSSIVDVYGTRMVEALPPDEPWLPKPSELLQVEQLRNAQAAVVGKSLAYYGLAPMAIEELTRNFVLKSGQGNFQVWVRR